MTENASARIYIGSPSFYLLPTYNTYLLKMTKMKFLIVDDNPMMREALKKAVMHEEDESAECDDGKYAVEMYNRFHPDWVLMDIEMSEVDGITATRNIMAADAAAKVVIVTGHDDKFFERAAKKAGAFQFISKEDLQGIQTIVRGKS